MNAAAAHATPDTPLRMAPAVPETDFRRYAQLGPLTLDCGETLPDVSLAYEQWGELAPDGSNAVLIEHALTGDSHVVGPTGPSQPTPGWWPGLVGDGAVLDPDEVCVIAVNVLGGCQGSTGPSSPAPDGDAWGGRFPQITIRDAVRAEALLADQLGIDSFAAIIGGSMGGMRALEWVASFPERVRAALVLATTGYSTAEQIAWGRVQISAITADPNWQGGNYYGTGREPDAGLAVARQCAHVTYRSEVELDGRFGRTLHAESSYRDSSTAQIAPEFTVENYIDHHGKKLVERFDAGSYVALTRAMNAHDIGRSRGGLAAALAGYQGHLHIADVDSDRLYLPRLSDELARAYPPAERSTITSPVGHDGFLVEIDQVEPLVTSVLEAGLS